MAVVSSPHRSPRRRPSRLGERLHEEIERVRVGVEEMLAEQGADHDTRSCAASSTRSATRPTRYVKKRSPQDGEALNSDRELEARTDELEQRLDQVEQERKYAEWRIHTNTEQMLDGLLDEVRAIADLLSRTR